MSVLERLLRPVNKLGRVVASGVSEVGYIGSLFAESLYYTVLGWRRGQPVRVAMVFEQMRQVGVDAIPIVTLLSFTVGVMLGIQFIAALSEFGAETQVIIAVAKSVAREFGVLITGIVVAGRSGSSFAARIGSMNVSQEVDALTVIGVDPVRYLAAPALIAMLVMMPILTIIANTASIFGAALYCSPTLDISVMSYVHHTLLALTPGDIGQGLAKSVVFALLITLVGVSTGFAVTGGAEGVGRATTRSVVVSISALVIADMMFSYFLNR
jgi:phospholipid/cholesterol/gamma-HCH transport system permease protein